MWYFAQSINGIQQLPKQVYKHPSNEFLLICKIAQSSTTLHWSVLLLTTHFVNKLDHTVLEYLHPKRGAYETHLPDRIEHNFKFTTNPPYKHSVLSNSLTYLNPSYWTCVFHISLPNLPMLSTTAVLNCTWRFIHD